MTWKWNATDYKHTEFEIMVIPKERGVWQKVGSQNVVSHSSKEYGLHFFFQKEGETSQNLLPYVCNPSRKKM